MPFQVFLPVIDHQTLYPTIHPTDLRTRGFGVEIVPGHAPSKLLQPSRTRCLNSSKTMLKRLTRLWLDSACLVLPLQSATSQLDTLQAGVCISHCAVKGQTTGGNNITVAGPKVPVDNRHSLHYILNSKTTSVDWLDIATVG